MPVNIGSSYRGPSHDMGLGLYQDRVDVVDQQAPATAPDGVIRPEIGIAPTVAGDPSSFIAHGAGFDSLGSYPGGARASQIEPDLTNVDVANPARSRDGYGLQGAGTPEQAINAPRQGAILDSRGIVHLGIGPGIPLTILLIIAGFVFLTRTKGPVIA